jgi:hypothetical protein
MRHINIGNYAILNESKSLGYYSLTEAGTAGSAGTAGTAGTAAASANTISIEQTDSPEVQAIKKLIIDNASKGDKADAEFLKLNAETANLVASGQSGPGRVTVKIGDQEYAVSIYVAGGKTADGKSGVYIDWDSTSKVIEGLDMNYLATQFRKGVEGSSIFGLNFGTDEDKLGALAGAIYRIGYEKNANVPEIFKALGTAYQTAYNESLMDAVKGDFSGTPEVLARAVYGDTITEQDIATGMGVDFLESLVVDVAIGLCTFGVGAAAKGLITGARAVRAAGAVNKLRGGFTAFRSGAMATTGAEATGVGVQGAANVSRLAAGANDFRSAQSGFSTITQAGKAAQVGGKIGAGVGAGMATGSAISSAASGAEPVPAQNFTAEDAAFAFCTQIRELAKGYTDGADELQITFMITSLSPRTAAVVQQVWSKNFGEDGDFYEYCVASEISGDMLSLCNGYWAGITGGGPLAGQVDKISQDMQKAPAQGGQQGGQQGGFTAVSEATVITSFSDFLKARR